jgi:hypothetical protein
LSVRASYAIPFITSSRPVRSALVSTPPRSTHPVTAPSAGLMRTICVLCHTLARISPFTHSSSFSCETGLGPSCTSTVRVTANVLGSRKVMRAVPSLWMSEVPSVVSPHPSPV